jgi:hypothetical protein
MKYSYMYVYTRMIFATVLSPAIKIFHRHLGPNLLIFAVKVSPWFHQHFTVILWHITAKKHRPRWFLAKTRCACCISFRFYFILFRLVSFLVLQPPCFDQWQLTMWGIMHVTNLVEIRIPKKFSVCSSWDYHVIGDKKHGNKLQPVQELFIFINKMERLHNS